MSGANPTAATGSKMRAEIAEQPERWLDLLDGQRDTIDAAAALIASTAPELLVFVARGSSDHAAMYGQYLAHNLLGIPAMLATPATVTAFGTTLRFPRAVAIAVSQSGHSPDLLATVSSIAEAGVPVIAITNDASSPAAELGSVHIPLSAGAELSVAATKTYTAELLAIALTLYRASGVEWDDLERRVHTVADAVAASLLADDQIERIADALEGTDRILVVGRGYGMATAKEGALKLMETNAIAASGWSAADATHGPLGQVVAGTGVVVLTAGSAGRDSVVEFASAAAAAGAHVVELGGGVIPAASVQIPVASEDDALTPLEEIVPLQRTALVLAIRRGLDPDNPPSLRKVTLTR